MKIENIKVRIGDIINGYSYSEYEDETDKGVYTNVNLNGKIVKLNIRPKYQRNFVYDSKKMSAVIDSILHYYPLNKMYWYQNADGSFGILDGQQRTLSILKFIDSKSQYEVFYNGKSYFYSNAAFSQNKTNKGETLKDAFLNYELDIALCFQEEIGDRESWFERINTCNKPLEKQEIRNANFQSAWLDDAKYHFSRTTWENGIPTAREVVPYMSGVKATEDSNSIKTQKGLERAIEWMCKKEGIKSDDNLDAVSRYMANKMNSKSESAYDMVEYALTITDWVKSLFPDYNHFEKIKDADWQSLYEKYHNNSYDAEEIRKQYDAAKKQLEDAKKEDSTFKVDYKGLFEYVLSDGNIKHLSTRLFADTYIQQKYDEQGGICPKCGEWYPIEEMQGDHRIAWNCGGETKYGNLQLLCTRCNCGKGQKTA